MLKWPASKTSVIRTIGMVAAFAGAAGSAYWMGEVPRWSAHGSRVVDTPQFQSFGLVTRTVSSRGPTLRISWEGDSLVAQRGQVSLATALERQLTNRADDAEPDLPIRIDVRGAGGDTAALGAERWRNAPCSDIAIVMYGTNDAAPRGWFRDKTPTGVEPYRAMLKEIVARHRTCDAQVIIVAPPPGGSRAVTRRVQPYREAAYRVARETGVVFVDPSAALAAVSTPLQHDALHLTDEGRIALAGAVAERFAAPISRP